MKKFVQFELWHDCSNNCLFCHTGKFGKDIDKKSSIGFILNTLDSINEKIGTLSLIGGEIFGGQLYSVRDDFYKLVDIIKNKINEKKIDRFFICSALLFKDRTDLIAFCDFLSSCGILDKCMICTSYDTIGRFITDDKFDNWKNNMLFLKKEYPDLQLHTEIILTGDFIDKVMTGVFDICQFNRTYKCGIDYVSPHIFNYNGYEVKSTKEKFNQAIPNFFPSREKFIKFVKKIILEQNLISREYFLSNKTRADDYYFILDGKHILASNRIATDGIFGYVNRLYNIDVIDGYIDSDIRLEDDINVLFERQ